MMRTGFLVLVLVAFVLGSSPALARTLKDSGSQIECTVGPAGDSLCQQTYGGNVYSDGIGYYEACLPLAFFFPDQGYNTTAGACGTALPGTSNGPAFTYDFVNFIYTPPDNTWGSATQRAFTATEICDNRGSANSTIKCSNTYSKQTTTSSTTTFTQGLNLEADFTFKVGGCALCPVEADSTFKITASVGFSESFSNSSTTGFSSALEADVPPGNCVVEAFSISYLNDYTVDFLANVEATCQQAGALRTADNDFKVFPCTDMEGLIKGSKKFTATLVKVDPYNGMAGQKAYITLAGSSIVNFGTVVNKAACDCSNSKCISEITGVGQSNAAAVNVAGAPTPGKAMPLADDQKTCSDCITNQSGGTGNGAGGAPATPPTSAPVVSAAAPTSA